MGCNSRALPQGERFRRTARLTGGANFKRVLGAKQRVAGRWFVACCTTNNCQHARLGIVLSARVLPVAAHRNRLKRITRELFRRGGRGLGARDVVLKLRTRLASKDLAMAEAEIGRLVGALIE